MLCCWLLALVSEKVGEEEEEEELAGPLSVQGSEQEWRQWGVGPDGKTVGGSL